MKLIKIVILLSIIGIISGCSIKTQTETLEDTTANRVAGAMLGE